MSYDPKEMEALRGFIEQEQRKVMNRKSREKKGGAWGAVFKTGLTGLTKLAPKLISTSVKTASKTAPKVVPKVVPKAAPNYQKLLLKANPTISQRAVGVARRNLTTGNLLNFGLSTALPLGLAIDQAEDYKKTKEQNKKELEDQSDEYYKIQDEANTLAIKEIKDKQKKKEAEDEKKAKEAEDKLAAEYKKITDENNAELTRQRIIQEEFDAKNKKEYDEALKKYQQSENARIEEKLQLILGKIFEQQEPEQPAAPVTTPVTTTKPVTKPVTTPTTGKKKGRGKELKGGLFFLPLLGLAASLIPTIIEGVEGEKQRKKQDELNRQTEATIAAQNDLTEKQNRQYQREQEEYQAQRAINAKIERDNRTEQVEYSRQLAVQAENERQLAQKLKQEEDRRIQNEISKRSETIENQEKRKTQTAKLAEARALQRQLQALSAKNLVKQTIVPVAKRIVEVAKTNLRRGRGADTETITFLMDYYQITKKEATKMFKELF